MSLQPLGLNSPQVDALRALGHMAQVVAVSEDRLQRSNDEALRTMSQALEQSDSNNRTLSDRNAQLERENLALQQRIQELTASNRAQQLALEAQLQARYQAAIAQLMPTCDRVIESINIIAPKSIEGIFNHPPMNAHQAHLVEVVRERHSIDEIKKAREGVTTHANQLKGKLVQLSSQQANP